MMPVPRFRIRTLMIAVAVVGADLAYFTWACDVSRACNCGNPILGAIIIHAAAGSLAIGYFVFR